MAQAREGAGRFARHLGIPLHLRTDIDLKGEPMSDQVIASEDAIVHDDALEIDRKVIAGQPVPPDLVEAYEKATGKAKSSRSKAGGDDA